MLKTLLALALSAAIMAALGAVGVHVLAGTEAGFLQAQQHALRAEAALAEAHLRRLPWDARVVTAAVVAEPSLGANLRTFAATIDLLDTATNAKLTKVLQARADQLSRAFKQVGDAAHKRFPEADSLAFVGADGVVLYAESARLGLGDNVRDAGKAGKLKEPAPDWLLKALAGAPGQTGVRVSAQAPFLWFTSAEPVFFKGKVAGVVLAEVPLHKLPPGVGSQVLLAVDGKVVLGRAPAGFDARSAAKLGPVGLVAAREIEGHAGAFSMPLVEVNPEHMGIWGARFHVAGTDTISGWVLQDLSDDYRDLGERQLQVAVLAGMGWFIMALLYSFVAFTRGPRAAPAQVAAAPEDDRRIMQPEELLAATEPESPWGDDLPAAAVETSDDGYQPMDSFDLGDAGQDMVEAEAFGEIGTASEPPSGGGVSVAPQRPRLLLGDLLETTIPQQAEAAEAVEAAEAPTGAGWNATPVSPETAAAAFEPDEAFSQSTRQFTAPNELTWAADRAVAETAPQSASARDQLLSILKSKKPAAPVVAEEDPLELEEAEPLELDPEPLELEEPDSGDPVEAARQRHYREVYEEFVRLRRSCNEPGELPYDKFLGRLTDTRSAVIAKHGCEDVAFAAYVKNGKAALKATPR